MWLLTRSGREDHVVSNYAQYCSVVKTGIGNARLVIGGEVDAGLCSVKSLFGAWDI